MEINSSRNNYHYKYNIDYKERLAYLKKKKISNCGRQITAVYSISIYSMRRDYINLVYAKNND